MRARGCSTLPTAKLLRLAGQLQAVPCTTLVNSYHQLLFSSKHHSTQRHFRDRHEVIDEDSEAYCWRRSGFFWRMRASLGLACAQATTLASQVFGKGNPRSRAGRTSA